jgi:hypothetical protein
MYSKATATWAGRYVVSRSGDGQVTLPVPITVDFGTDDPWALHVSFLTESNDPNSIIEWILSREQFAKFLDDMLDSGDGDVRLSAGTWHRGELIDAKLVLCTAEGLAEILIDVREIKVYLHQVDKLLGEYEVHVPAQSRHSDDSLYSDEIIEQGLAAILTNG